MKFANYHYRGKSQNNLGDHIQILTYDYLYNNMGVADNEVIVIDKDDLYKYDGEPVLLPVSMSLMNYKEHGIAGMFSSRITPIFFGLIMYKDELLPEEVVYLKKHEPVGCRDERTYNTMMQYGISSYLGGCITVTLPTRERCPVKQKKVFIIDPAKGINELVPEGLKQNAVWDTHYFREKLDNPKQIAKERYEQYRDEAKLVITSLLHCSTPCIAMGVPVVLARSTVSFRFAWLEALLKIYTPPEYAEIDWDPSPVVYDSHKELVKKIFMKRMRRQNADLEISKIHSFYMNRERNEYVIDLFIDFQRFLDTTWQDCGKTYEFSVWGLTQYADLIVSYIKKHYLNARLMHVYDLNVEQRFRGLTALHPDNIKKYPNETVFVTATSAGDYAKRFFLDIAKPDHMYSIAKRDN